MALSVGLMLLELGEDTICKINEYIAEMLAKSTADGAFHNIVIPISAVSTGLTVHCCPDLHERVEPRLRKHCESRKYTQRANSWFGLVLTPEGSVRLVAELIGKWKADPVMS